MNSKCADADNVPSKILLDSLNVSKSHKGGGLLFTCGVPRISFLWVGHKINLTKFLPVIAYDMIVRKNVVMQYSMYP